jgi:hypothetical protein
MTTTVTLVHPHETFQVVGKVLIQKCDPFKKDPGLAASPYNVTSEVSLGDFREFVSALKGDALIINNDNFKGLSRLCDEFHFRDLAERLSQFRNSADFQEERSR